MGLVFSSDPAQELRSEMFNLDVSIRLMNRELGEAQCEEAANMQHIDRLIRESTVGGGGGGATTTVSKNEMDRYKTRVIRGRARQRTLISHLERMETIKDEIDTMLKDFEFQRTIHKTSEGLDRMMNGRYSPENAQGLLERLRWQMDQLTSVNNATRGAMSEVERRAVDPEELEKLDEEIGERIGLVSSMAIPIAPGSRYNASLIQEFRAAIGGTTTTAPNGENQEELGNDIARRVKALIERGSASTKSGG